jgi:hypothetical protein
MQKDCSDSGGFGLKVQLNSVQCIALGYNVAGITARPVMAVAVVQVPKVRNLNNPGSNLMEPGASM